MKFTDFIVEMDNMPPSQPEEVVKPAPEKAFEIKPDAQIKKQPANIKEPKIWTPEFKEIQTYRGNPNFIGMKGGDGTFSARGGYFDYKKWNPGESLDFDNDQISDGWAETSRTWGNHGNIHKEISDLKKKGEIAKESPDAMKEFQKRDKHRLYKLQQMVNYDERGIENDAVAVHYTHDGYKDMNAELRYGKPTDKATEDQLLSQIRVNRLIKAIEEQEKYTEIPPQFYRRSLRDYRNQYDNLNPGDIIKDPGFMSTSSNEGSLMKLPDELSNNKSDDEKGVRMNIFGGYGRYFAEDVSRHPNENEVIFLPHTKLKYLGYNEKDKSHLFDQLGFDRFKNDIEHWTQMQDNDKPEHFYKEDVDAKFSPEFLNRMGDFHFQILRPKKFDDFKKQLEHDD